MGWFGVSDGDPVFPPPGAEVLPATAADLKELARQHADHGCNGQVQPVYRGNVLTGYYMECPRA